MLREWRGANSGNGVRNRYWRLGGYWSDCLGRLYRGDETIATPGQCLNEAWIFRRIVQGFAQTVDGCIHAVIKIDEGVSRPQPLPQIFPRNQFARMFQ